MEIIRGQPDHYSARIAGPDAKCHFCGVREPHAFWDAAAGTILVCRWCAARKLPLLIADALAGLVPGRRLESRHFQEPLPEILGAYWRGAALALSRRLHPSWTATTAEGQHPVANGVPRAAGEASP